MKKYTFLIVMATISMQLACQEAKKVESLPAEIQIKTATLPAPEADRENAMVYGYDKNGELTVLRQGSNNLVCLADDPQKEGISVACYSKKTRTLHEKRP